MENKTDKKQMYAIAQAGRALFGPFPLGLAIQQLNTMRKEEMQAAKRRFKKAYLHNSGDSFQITLAPDKRSALWTSAAIVRY